ncbi:MAG: hypothetical protein FJ000_06860, partial [Actinobacteria bacterium]|nr:hypothetical protein [Actinomycetota bacterium]
MATTAETDRRAETGGRAARLWIRLTVFLLLLAGVCLPVVSADTAVAAPVTCGDGAWVWQNPLPTGMTMTDVDFVDARHGWTVGSFGTVLRTADGGASWQRQATGTRGLMSGLDFRSRTSGLIVGADGYVARTTNAGRHWSKRRSRTKADLLAVTYAD